MSAGGSGQQGWRAGLRGLACVTSVIFLMALLRSWLPAPLAAGIAMFVTQAAAFRVPPPPPGRLSGWLRICLLFSALFACFIYLISFIGGADNIPPLF